MARVAALFLLILLLAAGAFADEREDPMDVIVALDKSLSMEEEIRAVKEYVSDTIIGSLLIPNDLLVVVAFYGQAEVIVSDLVTDAASRERMRAAVGAIRADGRWTDIGNALDQLQSQLGSKGRPGVPKHLLLITDGKQEAPPESRYWSADGSFTHAFLENTKTIQREGWKVQVLGLGTAADARDIAQKLSGVYTEVPEGATAEGIAESTREFFGSLAIEGAPRLSALGRGGRGKLGLTIKSSGYDTARSVSVNAIRLTTSDTVQDTILAAQQTFEIAPAGLTEIELPLVVGPELGPGRHAGTLEFVFAGPDQFVPTVLELELRVNSAFRNNIGFILPGAVLVLAGLALLALLLARRTAPARLSFRAAVKETPLPKGKDLFTLAVGESLYLREEGDTLTLDPEQTKQSIARLWAVGEKGSPPTLSLEVLNPKRFVHPEKIPGSPAGVEIGVKTEKGQKLHIVFEVPPGNA